MRFDLLTNFSHLLVPSLIKHRQNLPLLIALCLLPGCAEGLFGDLGGPRSNKPQTQQQAQTQQPAPQRQQAGQNSNSDIFANLLAFNSPTAPAMPVKKSAEEEAILYCPTIDVPDDTSYLRASHGVTGQDVEHQFSLVDVARECQRQGTQIALKIGAAGRLLQGPAGKPGHYSAPLRIAIRRDGDQTIAFSKLYTIDATLADGQSNASFQLVTEPILIPYLRSEADQDYTILIGFDNGKKPDTGKSKIANTTPISRVNRAGLGIGANTGLAEPQKKQSDNDMPIIGK